MEVDEDLKCRLRIFNSMTKSEAATEAKDRAARRVSFQLEVRCALPLI